MRATVITAVATLAVAASAIVVPAEADLPGLDVWHPTATTATADPGALIVHLTDSADPAQVAADAGADLGRQIGTTNAWRMQVPAAAADEVAAALARRGDVHTVEPDLPVHLTTNDTHYSNQWGLRKVGTPTLWQTTSGAGVTIAVLDTGVDATHPDLLGGVAIGQNFTVEPPTTDTSDVHGHGTSVAGVAAARTGNAAGVAGICPDCTILPVKVLTDSGSGTMSDVAEGIRWAVDNGADVINLSLGSTSPSLAVENAVAYAKTNAVVVVAGAGNNGNATKFYPAAYPAAVAVAGTDENDAFYDWSNYGGWVDVAAPGCNATTTLSGYGIVCGTSLASPVVAGAAALAIAAGAAAPADISDLLEAHAVPDPDLDVRYGRFDAAALAGGLPGRCGTGWVPVAGDFAGSGITQFGCYANGIFRVRVSDRSGALQRRIDVADVGFRPVTGDFDGDGVDSVGVFADGVWTLLDGLAQSNRVTTVRFGQPGDIPVVGDWNGDGIDTVGVVRDGVWILSNRNRGARADLSFRYGVASDRPIVGDWNGNGIDTPGVHRKDRWYLRNSLSAGPAHVDFGYGRAGDIDVIGDWDGDGIDSAGVVHSWTFHLRNPHAAGPADVTVDITG